LAERRGNGLQSRVHGFESRTHLRRHLAVPPRAIGAAVARFPDTEEVTGSIPVSPTASKAPVHRTGAFVMAGAGGDPRSAPEPLGRRIATSHPRTTTAVRR